MKEKNMTWEWVLPVLALTGFVLLWVFVFPRLKGGA
jgi:hypothetical protein